MREMACRTRHIYRFSEHTDGRQVGRATMHDDYPHMGRLRRVHGVVRGEDARMLQTWKGFVAQLKTFRLWPGEFMETANILTRGLGGSWGASSYSSRKSCEVLEARFRAVYNVKFS